ncbi:hypothetical protein QNH98_17400 [Myroides sp. mNGS23_01]|nr:hypothetical protein [Myroides sp. mNGS23_01]WHT38740.1 hypothetical protein QNH98_17400 [Myroides sp. mNGS23_01]
MFKVNNFELTTVRFLGKPTLNFKNNISSKYNTESNIEIEENNNISQEELIQEKELQQSEILENLKKETKKRPEEYDLYFPRIKTVSILEEIFDYYDFVSSSKYLAYSLTNRIGINCCPYCNRNYTFTVGELNNDTQRILRPDLDHYFPRSKFPLLGLSIYNLIPCCLICNSRIKGDSYLDIKEYFHPYIKYKDYSFKFDFEYENLNNFKLVFEFNEDKRIENHFDFFKLIEIYKSHSGYELKDLVFVAKKIAITD